MSICLYNKIDGPPAPLLREFHGDAQQLLPATARHISIPKNWRPLGVLSESKRFTRHFDMI